MKTKPPLSKVANSLPSTKNSKSSEPSHPREILAAVRPQDAAAVRRIAEEYKDHSLATVAGVIAGFGAMVLRLEHVAETMQFRRSATYLWMTINRDAEDFSAKLPVVIGEEGTQVAHEDDARSMSRNFSDWLGTLIMVGLEVAGNKLALAACSRGWEMTIFLGYEAHEAAKDQRNGGVA